MNTEIKIEKNIPIPKPRFRSYSYILHDMKPGDSIIVENSKLTSFRQYAWRHKMKIQQYRLNKDKVRIWRIA